MTRVTFDTHKIVRRLTEAGFSPAQAETVTDVLREARALDLAGLVTKADLAASEAQLTARIAENGRSVLQWTVGLFLAQSAVIAGLIKLLTGTDRAAIGGKRRGAAN
jgi:hypothetical protein